MAIDEASRLHLYERARNAWGDEAAGTLMEALPRDPDRFATKDDLALLGVGLRTEMAELRSELRTEIASSAANTVRTLMLGLVASNATLVGLVLAAVKLA